MLTVLKLQGLEWKQHAYIIPFLKSVFYQMIFQTRLHTGRNTKWALLENLTHTRLSQIQV